MPPKAEHIRIINILVKNPPTEKLLTKMIPNSSVTAKIIPPQIRPQRMPFLPLRFAAAAPAEKQPAHRAKLDITVKVPSLRSIAAATAEKTVLTINTAPIKANTVWITSSIRSFLVRSAAVFLRIKTPSVRDNLQCRSINDYADGKKIIRIFSK